MSNAFRMEAEAEFIERFVWWDQESAAYFLGKAAFRKVCEIVQVEDPTKFFRVLWDLQTSCGPLEFGVMSRCFEFGVMSRCFVIRRMQDQSQAFGHSAAALINSIGGIKLMLRDAAPNAGSVRVADAQVFYRHRGGSDETGTADEALEEIRKTLEALS